MIVVQSGREEEDKRTLRHILTSDGRSLEFIGRTESVESVAEHRLPESLRKAMPQIFREIHRINMKPFTANGGE